MIPAPIPDDDAERLAALHHAFGVSHATAAANSDAQWRDRAASGSQPEFLLAFVNGVAAGMIGGGVSAASEFNLIAMWARPEFRGTAVAAGLVDAIKARAVSQGHARVVLTVSPANHRAAAFYRKQGFSFLPEWEALASHPDIKVQKMAWRAIP
jgi:ribosomal protein S18 acetylase RimI-like enzyme